MSDTSSIDIKGVKTSETTATSTTEKPAETQKPSLQPLPPAPKEIPKEDQFQSSATDKSQMARQMAQTPRQLGHKMLPQQPQDRSQTTVSAFKLKTGDFTPEPQVTVTPKNYLKLSQEGIFRQPHMQNSGLHRYVLQRAFPQRVGGEASLSPAQLATLIRARHQVQDRGNLANIIRYEIQQQKIYRRETDRKADRKTSSESSGSAKAHREGISSISGRMKSSDGTSKFEETLRQTQEGEEIVLKLPKGKAGPLKGKTEGGWKTFFSNILRMGSGERSAIRNISSILEALHRGAYKALTGEKGLTMVTDLRFSDGGRIASDKFARILIENPHLLRMLEQLKPGDKIPKELLEKFGKELQYKQLFHKTDTATPAAKDAARNANLSQLKSPVSAAALARLEMSLIEERNRRAGESLADQKNILRDGDGKTQDQSWFGRYFFHYGGDPKIEWQKRIGKPKLWIFISYALGAIFLGLAGYLVFRLL